ncbi:MAG TPA: NAD(P)-dependent oxidoreductase [Candidatus Omnitrophota bacterium]|nr:NAD(P)-dependent oxidoreductase [Candidatus Omnitrophota bacterium]
MKIFITGGLGYIGGRLASFLKEKRPHDDIILSTTRRQYPVWAKGNCRVVYMDLQDKKSIQQALNQESPEVIVHLAALPQKLCQENNDLAVLVNVEGTRHAAHHAAQLGIKKFIYFSTFQIYGQLSGDINEQYPADPQNNYARSKWEAEKIVSDLNGKGGMKTAIFRLSNAYGYPQDDEIAETAKQLVFNAFCRDAVETQRIVPQGNPFRDFIAMTDVLGALEHVLSMDPQRWQDGIFNLGGECCLSVCDVALKVAQIYEDHYRKSVQLDLSVKDKERKAQPFVYQITKLKKTGFKLRNNMEEEVLATMRMFEKPIKAGKKK